MAKRKKIGEEITDIVDIGMQRFSGETFDLRELVMPNTLMVKEAAEGKTPYECYKYVVETVVYPRREGLPKGLDFIVNFLGDLHILIRHPPRLKISLVPLDFWKLPNETLRDNVGDCEDTSFLTASMLRAAGASANEVYVVIGTVDMGGVQMGHAWVEWNGRLLETTYDMAPTEEDLPLVEKIYGTVYFPEIKFNDSVVIPVYYPKAKTAYALEKKGKNKLVLKKQRIPKLKGKKLKRQLSEEIGVALM